MAGIYFHIPFCKQACFYCDFHFSTVHRNKTEVLDMMKKELRVRKDHWDIGPLSSIYFGGGTPSICSPEEIAEFILLSDSCFGTVNEPEVTIEANPDDLSPAVLENFRQVGVNRFSLGVQSFDDRVLRSLNRAHDAEQAKKSLEFLPEAGFENFSVDLIFGCPEGGMGVVENDLDILIAHGVPHISTYGLTVEPNTALAHFVEKEKVVMPGDEEYAREYRTIVERLDKEGYEHYEVSNFCRSGYLAIHNSSYWKGEPYLGIGPGAHSFKGKERIWNVANNRKYVQALEQDSLPYNRESLDPIDRVNEAIMTGLRTKWGIYLPSIREEGYDLENSKEKEIEEFLTNGFLERGEDHLYLTRKGTLLSDHITAELFLMHDDH